MMQYQDALKFNVDVKYLWFQMQMISINDLLPHSVFTVKFNAPVDGVITQKNMVAVSSFEAGGLYLKGLKQFELVSDSRSLFVNN